MKRLSIFWPPFFIALVILDVAAAVGWPEQPAALAAQGAAIRPAAPGATTVTLIADADATIKYGSPDGNFGGAGTALELEYAGGGRAISCILLHFNLSASLPSGATIDSAQLQVRLNSGTGVSPITVLAYTVNDNWGETSVTWNTGPEMVDPIVEASVGTTQGWATWTVTAIARTWQAERNYGLELCGPASGADWYRTFTNRHLGEAQPRLVVTYSTPAATATATSTATPTRTPTLTATATRTRTATPTRTPTAAATPTATSTVVDTTPPTNPATITSSTHTAGAWSNKTGVTMQWSAAQDTGGSGVRGYYAHFNHDCALPGFAVFTTAATQFSQTLEDGVWCFHVRTVDRAGNWATFEKTWGPFYIDTQAPSNPTLYSFSHAKGAWSHNATLDMSLSNPFDTGISGLQGYSIFLNASPTANPDTVVNSAIVSNWLATPGEGVWFFHIRTVDRAGNWSTAAHYGAIQIDLTPATAQISSPAQVSNKTFTVSWSGNDNLSGVASYEVRYRDMTSGNHAWTPWFAATTSTSAAFTGWDGHRYTFQVRAIDKAGNIPAWSATAQSDTAIATVDFSTIGLEVTQAVQDLNNSVPLVEGKRTFARFHVKSLSGDHGPVSAQLNLYRNGQFVQALLASNPNGAITIRQNPDRGQLEQSFYFDLPASWLHGTITLEGRISFGWAQTNTNNDTATATITFTGVPPLRVWILDMCYTWNGTDHDVPWADIDAITSYLRRMYPISNLVVPGVAILTPCLSAWQGEQQNLNDLALIRQSWDLTRPWERVYGVFSNDYAATNWGCAGGLSYVPSTIATGVTGPTPGCYSAADQDGTWGDEIAAHELGHALGRPHAPSVDSPLPYCDGQENGRDGEWPKDHTQGNISPTTSATSPAAMYGFDIETLQVYPPTWKDIMSYCSPQWISDYTWKKIQKQLLDEAEWWQAQSAKLVGPPQDYLAVSGKVDMDTQQVQLGDFYHLTSAVEPTGRVPGEYRIRLLGAGGVALADYPFTPQFNYPDYPSPGSGPLTALISEAVLWNPSTTRVAIYRGANEVAGRNVSPHTPVVTILALHGGETFTGPFNLQWQASDGDSDPLTYLLQYSVDGGLTWRPLSGVLSVRSITVDPAALGGTTQGKFRVLASDGVNTGVDESDGVFSVPDKAPAVRMESPAVGAHYIPGQPVALIGQAMDVEDGTLTGEALQWTSSLSGALGTGEMLHVTDLPSGPHTITLTAQDRGGHRVNASVTILVADLDERLYLPLLYR